MFFRKYFHQLLLWVGIPLNALLMLIFSYIWLGVPLWVDIENSYIQATSAIKQLVFGIGELSEEEKKRFLFIDISWEKELIDKNTEGTDHQIGKQAITDRKKLAQLFHLINTSKAKYEFILCDIMFDEPSPNDSILEREIRLLPNFLASAASEMDTAQKKQTVKALAINVPHALSEYETTEDKKILKYKLMYGDSIKTIPLKMYEMLYDKKFETNQIISKLDSHWVLNSFVMEYPIREFHFQDNMSEYRKWYLMDFLEYFDSIKIATEITDKIIVIGDFEDKDKHETIYGEMSGALILINAFLYIEECKNRIHFLMVLFLYLSFMFMSYQVISGQSLFEKWKTKLQVYIKYKIVADFILDFISYATFIIIVSSIAYFLFNIHLTIIYLATYLSLLEEGLKWVKNRLKLPTSASAT